MIDPLRPAYRLGTSEARRSVGSWVVVATVVVAAVASASLAASMLGTPGGEARLTEPPVVDGPWVIEWSRTMEPPSVEQESQVRALRLVAGGAAALVGVLCLLIVAGLWRQRLALRRAEYFVHWALGARRLQITARLAGEARMWALGIVALGALVTAAVLGLVEGTFPGDASVSPDVASSAILLTALAVVGIRWESDAGPSALEAERSRAWELFASPTLVGAVGFAALSGVGLLALHAPHAAEQGAETSGTVVGASLSELPVDARGDEILSWTVRASAAGAPVGLASAGAARAAGRLDQATTECGRCFEGGIPVPLKAIRAEVHAVAPDTFVHIRLAVARGRDFDGLLDRGEPTVAIVSEALANRHFERGRAIGRRLRVGEANWLTVVGIVGDRDDVRGPMDYAIYVPLAQARPTEVEVLAEDRAGIEAIIAGAAPEVAFGSTRSRAEVFAVHRWFRALLNALGIGALVLLGGGLWVSAGNEAEAARYEVSVRRAVGARQRAIWRFYLWFASRRLFAALVAGAWLSLFLGAGLAEAYGSIPQIDWAVWGAVAAWVSAIYLFGSAPAFVRTARAPVLAGLEEGA